MTITDYQAIVIGASAGAVEALSLLLPVLPADFPLPIMIVVHLPADKKSLLTEVFQAKCQVNVMEAEDKDPIKPGTVYFAPPDYHLLVEKNKCLSLSSEEPVFFSRPSIDVLFETAADTYGPDLLGIVLTGANEDGTKGSAVICKAGGKIIVQDPVTAQSPIMPQAALAACPGATILSLQNIAALLKKAGH